MSKLEKNILAQAALIPRILEAKRPVWMDSYLRRRVWFVGIGTSYYAAQISRWLWQRFVSAEAEAIHSFDFVRETQPLRSKDVVVLFSHGGSKSFTLEAARLTRKKGATTVGITCQNSPWKKHLTHRLETCEREDVGVFTKSMTTALAWIARWINDKTLIQGLRQACQRLEQGPSFPSLTENSDLVLVGDGVREWVAREIALKTQEAAYLRSRAFGLEEFLHGPRISVGEGSVVIGFSDTREKRWDDARKYLKTVEVPFLEIHPKILRLPIAAAWMGQLFWGQRLTLDICRQLGRDPDAMRTQDPTEP